MPRLSSKSLGNGKPTTPATKSRPACEKYCRELCELHRALEALDQQEREMYELDAPFGPDHDRLQVVLANQGICVRDQCFPEEYATASRQRLQVFFQLPGRIFWGQDRVEVELKRFNDRAINRDLEKLCTKEARRQLCLPDGRRLLFRLQGASILLLDTREKEAA